MHDDCDCFEREGAPATCCAKKEQHLIEQGAAVAFGLVGMGQAIRERYVYKCADPSCGDLQGPAFEGSFLDAVRAWAKSHA